MFNGLTTASSWSPGVITLLVMSCLLYVVCLRIAFVRARRNAEARPISAWHVGAFFLGILLVAVLLMSPINTIARTQLFSMHMGQVVALTTICAPLLIAGWPASLLRSIDAIPVIGKVVRFFLSPLVASLLFNGTFLLWHLPLFYDPAMKNPVLYHVMVGSIFVMSILNWWPLVGAPHPRQTLSLPQKMAYAFFDGQPVDIFAFVLVFSGVPLYHLYVIPQQLLLTPFGDQAVAGAILLIPGLVDLGVMSPLFLRWLVQLEQGTKLEDLRRQREREMEEEEVAEDEEGQNGSTDPQVHLDS